MNKCNKDSFNNYVIIHIVVNIIVLLFSIIGGIWILVNPNTTFIGKIVILFVIVSAIYLATDRDTYLPFLGKTIIPLNIVTSEKIPEGANIDYILNLNGYQNGTRVFYWGAKSTNKNDIVKDPLTAYGDYSNSGVAIVYNEKANLKFFCPDKYAVGVFNNVLDRHLHYRIECPNSGLMSSVKTIKIDCN